MTHPDDTKKPICEGEFQECGVKTGEWYVTSAGLVCPECDSLAPEQKQAVTYEEYEALQARLKEAESRIKELEKEVEELMQVDYWQDRYNIAVKENAELKQKLNAILAGSPKVRRGPDPD